MNLLIELVIFHNQGRKDYFVGGNMFIYFSKEQARDQEFRGPDFFYVADVPLNPSRAYWVVWEEGGKYPDVIIELSSPTTAAEDQGVKKDVYEQIFRTHEYFIYDPDTNKCCKVGVWTRIFRYRPIQPNEQGWLWCEMLGLWLGTWTGKYQGRENVYLRFFDKDGNLVASLEEGKEAEKKRADFEKKTEGSREKTSRSRKTDRRRPRRNGPMTRRNGLMPRRNGLMPKDNGRTPRNNRRKPPNNEPGLPRLSWNC